jgi:hypothetical protein
MVEHLPPSSAAHRAALGHSWRDTEYLLAELNDRVGSLFELTRAVNSEDDATFHTPQRIPRPGDHEREAEEAARLTAEKRSVMSLIDQLLPKG